ncbi:hypothetical protein SAMN04489712_106163 [Thermomonospora echinospora]|uniref:Neocarzinostatin family protein n=1 Tax=Thermomonospora echinospora TaxID=1992 RepID=A0A1H6B1P2_9ACTN|nr:hypothetical protein [Thermomonospora echinospora]SEG54530.1 hypothetical protein SAMN04489712_106163 [Thermomonospora echinospora]
MHVLARFATPVLAAATVLGLVATSASAAPATIRRGGPAELPYSGAIRFDNLGPLSVNARILGVNVTAQCSTAVLNGTLTSSSTGSLNSATVTGCSSNVGGSANITFQNLPYTDATVDYAPIPGGRDGTLTFTDPDLRIRANLTVFGISATCYYGFGSTVSSLTFDLYNPDNPNRPNPSVAEAQGKMNNASLDRLSGSGAICPATGTANGAGIVRGEKTAGSGVFDQTLYATG